MPRETAKPDAGHRVCPWWLGYWLVSPVRRLWESPRRLFGGLVREGMTVVEPGCGMGYFTLDLARMVGPHGRVVAVDVQEKMLAGLARRARRAGLAERVDARLVTARGLGIGDLAGRADLAVAIHMVHEVPDQAAFFADLHAALKAGGGLLVVEPPGHVSAEDFAATVAVAERAGFVVDPEHGAVARRSAFLRKAG